MEKEKVAAAVDIDIVGSTESLDNDFSPEASKSTRHDVRDMSRMGHKQQLVRQFGLWKSTAFVCVAMSSWELTVFSLNQGLVGGGRAGLVWSFIWCFFGFLPVFLSMAEMSSMAPISGSQYHWVSEFAPEKWQKPLSYFTGWMSTLSWQAGNTQGILLTGQIIQAIVLVQNENYGMEAWQGTLFTIAVAAVTFCCNFFFTKHLPRVQNLMFLLHVGLYLIIIVVVAIYAPRATSKQVWTDFTSSGDWRPGVLGVLACQVSALSGNCGADTATHMSEEIHDASRNVPRAMVAAYLANAVFSISIIISITYALPDLDSALNDITTYPVVYVLRQCMSEPCLVAYLVGFVAVLFCGNINYLLAVSRDLWAFARDRGTPFATTLATVNDKRHIPANAIAASCIIASLLSVLYIGSSTAYYAITSLGLVSVLSCYATSLTCFLWRRVYRPETLPPMRWSLGRYGIVTNVLGIAWTFWAFFWAFWPQAAHPDLSTFNWACVMFTGVTIVSGLLYAVWLRKVYDGPVMLVAGRKGNAAMESDIFE